MEKVTIPFAERKAALESLCQEVGAQFASEIDPDQASPLKTHIPAIDNLGGGFPRNSLSEVIETQAGCGGTFLIHRLIDQIRQARGYVALVDGSDSFAPDSVRDSRSLEHLYWVRCRGSQEAIRVSDLIAGDGNFSLLLIDLRLSRQAAIHRIPGNRWYRMQRSVTRAHGTCIALTPMASVAAAKLRFHLVNPFEMAALEQSQAFLQEQLQVETLSESRIARIG